MENSIRNVSSSEVTELVNRLFREACEGPVPQVQERLVSAHERERSLQGREILQQLADNNVAARQLGIPACQDTGMAVVFVDVGQDVHLCGGGLTEAISDGVQTAYAQGYCRASVADPLTRENTRTNLPAVIHTRIVPGNSLRIRALPKGFGSENMSRIAMLKPSDGKRGIEAFVERCALDAGGSPCPPVFLGVGIGGTFDSCALLSKYALLEMFEPRTRPELEKMETALMQRINASGMGPMGLGGDTYCLGIRMKTEPTHIAGLPVAVNFCCHMLRLAEGIL